jgi:hypothetical protein
MAVLSYRCPTTSKEVRTGIESDANALAKLGKLKVSVSCPHCRDNHAVPADSMFFAFAPSTTPSPAPLEAMVAAGRDR